MLGSINIVNQIKNMEHELQRQKTPEFNEFNTVVNSKYFIENRVKIMVSLFYALYINFNYL